MHHSSTSTDIPNFIEIEETFCGRTDVQTLDPLMLLDRLGRSRPNKGMSLEIMLVIICRYKITGTPTLRKLPAFANYQVSCWLLPT